jgi:hypothetical protein
MCSSNRGIIRCFIAVLLRLRLAIGPQEPGQPSTSGSSRKALEGQPTNQGKMVATIVGSSNYRRPPKFGGIVSISPLPRVDVFRFTSKRTSAGRAGMSEKCQTRSLLRLGSCSASSMVSIRHRLPPPGRAMHAYQTSLHLPVAVPHAFVIIHPAAGVGTSAHAICELILT